MGRSVITRPRRHELTARAVARPVARTRTISRSVPARTVERTARIDAPSSRPTGFQPDPYVDYGRFLTPEGGVLLRYKDLDLRFRHTAWRVLAWSVSTGFEAWLLFRVAPPRSLWISVACLAVAAIVNWLIVARPVEIYRGLEIRPDCMIIDGTDVFWLAFMEARRLEFLPDGQGNQRLCGVYGTRFVEYLTLRRFDEGDRMFEVFAAHLCEAMKQLWEQPV